MEFSIEDEAIDAAQSSTPTVYCSAGVINSTGCAVLHVRAYIIISRCIDYLFSISKHINLMFSKVAGKGPHKLYFLKLAVQANF